MPCDFKDWVVENEIRWLFKAPIGSYEVHVGAAMSGWVAAHAAAPWIILRDDDIDALRIKMAAALGIKLEN